MKNLVVLSEFQVHSSALTVSKPGQSSVFMGISHASLASLRLGVFNENCFKTVIAGKA